MCYVLNVLRFKTCYSSICATVRNVLKFDMCYVRNILRFKTCYSSICGTVRNVLEFEMCHSSICGTV